MLPPRPSSSTEALAGKIEDDVLFDGEAWPEQISSHDLHPGQILDFWHTLAKVKLQVYHLAKAAWRSQPSDASDVRGGTARSQQFTIYAPIRKVKAIGLPIYHTGVEALSRGMMGLPWPPSIFFCFMSWNVDALPNVASFGTYGTSRFRVWHVQVYGVEHYYCVNGVESCWPRGHLWPCRRYGPHSCY